MTPAYVTSRTSRDDRVRISINPGAQRGPNTDPALPGETGVSGASGAVERPLLRCNQISASGGIAAVGEERLNAIDLCTRASSQ